MENITGCVNLHIVPDGGVDWIPRKQMMSSIDGIEKNSVMFCILC